jgi:hypothetical protein
MVEILEWIGIRTVAMLLALAGVCALATGWFPVLGRFVNSRVARGPGARAGGVFFILGFPAVVFVAPELGRKDVDLSSFLEYAEVVRQIEREFRDLTEKGGREPQNGQMVDKEADAQTAKRDTELRNLTRKLKTLEQEREKLRSKMEAQAIVAWAGRLLAICFALGLIVACVAGWTLPKEVKMPEQPRPPSDGV